MSTELDLDDNRDVMRFFASLGIIKITIDFDGSGDSGQVNDISIEGLVDKPENIKPPELGGKTIRQFVDDYADRLLEQSQYDWYNNDGGFGDITIRPGAEKPVEFNMNVRCSASQLFELALDDDGDLTTVKAHEVTVD